MHIDVEQVRQVNRGADKEDHQDENREVGEVDSEQEDERERSRSVRLFRYTAALKNKNFTS